MNLISDKLSLTIVTMLKLLDFEKREINLFIYLLLYFFCLVISLNLSDWYFWFGSILFPILFFSKPFF